MRAITADAGFVVPDQSVLPREIRGIQPHDPPEKQPHHTVVAYEAGESVSSGSSSEDSNTAVPGLERDVVGLREQ
jgi:hypothetical protein